MALTLLKIQTMTKAKIDKIVMPLTPRTKGVVLHVWQRMPVWARRRAYRNGLWLIYETDKETGSLAWSQKVPYSTPPRHEIAILERHVAQSTDDTLHGTIAHELAHVVLGHCEMPELDDGWAEVEADELAQEWGFESNGFLAYLHL